MSTNLKKVIKKIIFAFSLLYGVNILLNNMNIYIPINLYSVAFVSILGIPGFAGLATLYFICL